MWRAPSKSRSLKGNGKANGKKTITSLPLSFQLPEQNAPRCEQRFLWSQSPASRRGPGLNGGGAGMVDWWSGEGGGGGEGVTTLERKRQRKVREREKEEENQNSKSTSEVEGFHFSLFHRTLAFQLPSLLNCMGSLATFAPAAARPCTSVAPNTSRSSNLAAPRAAGCAARVSAVVALVRSPKQQSCSSSSSSSFGRRSSIVVARAATVATASLPPLAPLDGKERGRKREREKEDWKVFEFDIF